MILMLYLIEVSTLIKMDQEMFKFSTNLSWTRNNFSNFYVKCSS